MSNADQVPPAKRRRTKEKKPNKIHNFSQVYEPHEYPSAGHPLMLATSPSGEVLLNKRFAGGSINMANVKNQITVSSDSFLFPVSLLLIIF